MPHINLTWWNLQNFFDTDDDPISADFDYTPENGWTPERYAQKRDNLAAALKATHGGEGPHLLAVAEIEKDALLADLIQAMGATHLEVAVDPAGTQDLRGIDVAVAYDRRFFEVVSLTSHVVHFRYRTRDIFELVLRFKPTGEELVFLPTHGPSRSQGRFESEPLRIAVAENIAYLVDGHLKVVPAEYETLRAAGNLAPVNARWETKVLIVGDFNDEPFDRSVTDHLKASKDLDLVTGNRNDMDRFYKETADYRGLEALLFNACANLAGSPNVGSYYRPNDDGGKTTNPYQLLDQLVVSRGLAGGSGLTLDPASVGYFTDALVATPSQRPRPFDRKSGKGASDHLPLVARLNY